MELIILPKTDLERQERLVVKTSKPFYFYAANFEKPFFNFISMEIV